MNRSIRNSLFLTAVVIDTMLAILYPTNPANPSRMRFKQFPVFLTLIAIIVGCSRSGVDIMPDFSGFPEGTPRKEAFINYLSPLVANVNQEISKERQRALELEQKDHLTLAQRAWLRKLAKKYRFKKFDPVNPDWRSLLTRVDTIPPSIVLAQGANESAWGTSRFAREGNNYFGQWCFRSGCGIVPENRGSGKKHEVARFDNPTDSVRSYIMNINSHRAYRELRAIRETLRKENEAVTGIALAAGLSRYSERGQEYIDELKAMIRFNGLDELDRS